MIAFTIKTQARNNEENLPYRQGKLYICSTKGSNRSSKTALGSDLVLTSLITINNGCVRGVPCDSVGRALDITL